MARPKFFLTILIITFVLGISPLISTVASAEIIRPKVLVYSEGVIIPPPVNVLAVAISDSQIDLSWAPPDDPTGVEGYYIYRDGIRLTSTNQLNYSDRGLEPLTSYQYYVTSFDSWGRESVTPPAVSISTLSVPVSPTPSVIKSKTGNVIFKLSNFKVTPIKEAGKRSLLLSFDTSWPTLSTIRYGLDEEASLAIVRDTKYSFQHSYLIDSLPKSPQYYLAINLTTPSGFSPVLSNVYVSGKIFGDFFAPGDVSDLKLTPRGNSVFLSWSNPPVDSFDKIYVIRSDKFYPVNRSFGLPLQEGRGTSYLDSRLEPNKNYYYGIFVCDKNKVCSLGSYAVIYLESVGEVKLITATTSPQVVTRQCEQKKVFSGDKFLLSAPANEAVSSSRLCLARLARSGQLIGTHQLLPNENGIFESSLFSILSPGLYRYEIECYDAYGSGTKEIACGEITVASTGPQEKNNYWHLLVIFLLLILLPLCIFFIWKSKKNKKCHPKK